MYTRLKTMQTVQNCWYWPEMRWLKRTQGSCSISMRITSNLARVLIFKQKNWESSREGVILEGWVFNSPYLYFETFFIQQLKFISSSVILLTTQSRFKKVFWIRKNLSRQYFYYSSVSLFYTENRHLKIKNIFFAPKFVIGFCLHIFILSHENNIWGNFINLNLMGFIH